MKDSKNDKIGPQFVKPTDDEVNEVVTELKEKYEIFIPQEDAIRYWKLKKELGWWMSVEMNAEKPEAITDEMAKELQISIQKAKGANITLAEAYRQARKSLSYTIPMEKDRIAKEMRGIIKKYR
jgi:hypothetical protein